MIRHVLLILTLLVCCQASLAVTTVEEFVASGAVNPEECAVMVMDLSTGKIIESYNADVPLIPASVTKAVTVATLLEKSGLNYRYHTQIFTQGRIKDGVLEGNLVVEGGGDPALGSAKEPKGEDIVAACINALKKKKVSEIEGDLIMDSAYFPLPATPATWSEADKRESYGAGTFGINFANNSSGSASVENPAEVLRRKLADALNKAGINVVGQDMKPDGRKVLLLDHLSPRIEDIMRSCMMRSDNMYAETFLRTLAVLGHKKATPDEGAAVEMKYWKGRRLPMKGVNIVDGSGLSRSNRLTAQFLCDVLIDMADNVEYVSFFPLAGQEGTLRNFMKGSSLDSYIALKTGSMRGIQCYAGYKLDDDFAPTHAVVVMVNSFPKDRASVKAAVAKMLTNIFEPSSSQDS